MLEAKCAGVNILTATQLWERKVVNIGQNSFILSDKML